MDIGKVITYFIYAGLSYRTFKRLKPAGAKPGGPQKPETQSTQRTNELQDLLTWVGCTIIIYLQEIIDWFFHWIPLYTFWKIIIILVVFSEKELTLKILYSLENIIVRIESWVDEQVNFFTNFSANFSMPMFKLLITNSALMVQGGSLEQLNQLESLCDKYLEKIREVRGKGPKKLIRKLTEIRVASPDDKMLKCKVGIMMKKIAVQGEKPTFFPHEIRYNEQAKEIEWVAEGDDKVNKDKFKRAKTISTADRTLEIEMLVNKKIVQFPDATAYMQWAQKLTVSLTRTVTHK